MKNEIEINYLDHESLHLKYNFYNGAMSTINCDKLTSTIRALNQFTGLRYLIVEGFSNGLNLNFIQNYSEDKFYEASMANIKAINNIVRQLHNTKAFSASIISRNSGAGGVFVPLVADRVYCNKDVILNPTYHNMGLFGSEFHTYFGKKRLGDKFDEVLHGPPVNVAGALKLNLIDEVCENSQDGIDKALKWLKKTYDGKSVNEHFIRKREMIPDMDAAEK